MEAAPEQDPFASIIHLCQATSSQEAKLLNFPFARESENFSDSTPEPFSASEPTGIVMVSPPDSVNDSVHQHQQLEDDAVFHTPPEEHPVQSSGDQNLDELRAEEPLGLKRVRVSQNDGDDESELKKCVDGEAGDTEPVETEGNDDFAHGDTEVISDSGDVAATVNLAEDCDVVVQKIVNGHNELGKKLNKRKRNVNENTSDLSGGSLDSGKIEEELVKLKHTAAHGSSIRTRHNENGIDRETQKDERNKGKKRIEEIDKFRYKNVDGKGKTLRKLPLTMMEKEKNVGETMEREKIGAMGNFWDVLKVVVLGDHIDGGGHEGDVDFLETAKRRGLKFPRPRWWLPEAEGVDE